MHISELDGLNNIIKTISRRSPSISWELLSARLVANKHLMSLGVMLSSFDGVSTADRDEYRAKQAAFIDCCAAYHTTADKYLSSSDAIARYVPIDIQSPGYPYPLQTRSVATAGAAGSRV